jgi:hypothetical protein
MGGGSLAGSENDTRCAEHLDRRHRCEYETRAGEEVRTAREDQVASHRVRDAAPRDQDGPPWQRSCRREVAESPKHLDHRVGSLQPDRDIRGHTPAIFFASSCRDTADRLTPVKHGGKAKHYHIG